MAECIRCGPIPDDRRCAGCTAQPIAGAHFCVGCYGHRSWPWWLSRKMSRGNLAHHREAITQAVDLIHAFKAGPAPRLPLAMTNG